MFSSFVNTESFFEQISIRFGMKYFVARERQLSMRRYLINFVQDTALTGDRRVLKENLGMVFVLSHFHLLSSAIIILNHLLKC